MAEAEAETGPGGAGEPIIRIAGLNKWFGTFHVLRDIDLDGGRAASASSSAGRRGRASRR